jgi:hypothetical protein
VTYRNEIYLEKKEKDLFKKMLPMDMEIKGHCIKNILMLFGIKKEEDFLKDMQDPFEVLLLTDENFHERTKRDSLRHFVKKLPLR